MQRCEAIRQYLLENEEQIIQDTLFLVKHQSPTIRKDLVDQCSRAVEELVLRRLGLQPTAQYPQEARGRHLYFQVGQGRKKALLLGHFDTVWNVDDLPIRREPDRLAGPGCYDMKYGIVAGIWAIKALEATGGLDGTLGLFFNADEEMGSRTSRAHFEPIAREYANALVLEGASLGGTVKVGRKSTGDFFIRIHGRAAHAGTDYQKGRSAILEAAWLVQELFAMTDLDRGTTVNVGVLSGGTKFNVIAGQAEMKVDVRVTSVEEGERITRQILALQPRQEGVRFEITGGMNRPPFAFNEANRRLYETARAAAGELGKDLPSIIVGGGSDGNFTSSWGIPTLDGMGAVGDGAHARHEHIRIRESLEHTAVLANLLTKL